MGVGAFAAAGARWAATCSAAAVGVEPDGAACVTASLVAGRPVEIATTGTAMAGLDAASPSRAAWPSLAAGLAGSVVVRDDEADAAARDLAALGIAAGESGAAGVAGLLALAAARRLATFASPPSRREIAYEAPRNLKAGSPKRSDSSFTSTRPMPQRAASAGASTSGAGASSPTGPARAAATGSRPGAAVRASAA